jgi:chemotaxis protein CheC
MANISPIQLDFLREMGSIGVGHAAMGLANLLGKRISITNPKVHSLALEKVVEYLGGVEQMVCALQLKISGEISGSIILVFPDESSIKLLNLWFADKGPAQIPFDAFYESALKELANIATGAYLTALSKLTGHTLLCSIPLLASDMLGSLLDEILVETTVQEDFVIVIDNEFVIEKQPIQGFILLIMTPQSMTNIFTKLEIR